LEDRENLTAECLVKIATMKRVDKSRVKDFLGVLPLTAELYWSMRQPGRPITAKFDLHRLKKLIPEWKAQAEGTRGRWQVAGSRSQGAALCNPTLLD
jgi:hypothetical protein